MVDVSIIIVHYNNYGCTKRCLESIRATQIDCSYEIIVVDNHSPDGSGQLLRHDDSSLCLLSLDSNYGFGYANNRGAQKATGKYLLFLNNDTEIRSDFLSPLLTFLDTHPQIGIVGPKLINQDGSFQLSAGRLPSIIQEMKDKVLYSVEKKIIFLRNHLERQQRTVHTVGWVTGAALLISKQWFVVIGGFDEHYFMYFEDKDLCKASWDHGKQTIFFPNNSLMHIRGGSVNKDTAKSAEHCYRQSQIYYYQKHRNALERFILKYYLIVTHKGSTCLQKQ